MSEAGGDPVETFSASWLELREPVDHRSRAHAILSPLQQAWTQRGWSRVLDLGSGTGSNLRYLAPRLGGRQQWTLLDHDAKLLERARGGAESREGPDTAAPPEAISPAGSSTSAERSAPWQLTKLHPVVGDLAREGLAQVAHTHLVTASALLDLVSETWLQKMVTACRVQRAAALFALSYDGSVRWEPEEPLDQEVLHAVNLHQEGDKGLGAALGPGAAQAAEALFSEAGYTTWLHPAPWVLGPGDRALIQELTAGWVHAAEEAVPQRAQAFRRWGENRLRSLEGESFTLTVDHWDLLALPPLPPVASVEESGPSPADSEPSREESGAPPPPCTPA